MGQNYTFRFLLGEYDKSCTCIKHTVLGTKTFRTTITNHQGIDDVVNKLLFFTSYFVWILIFFHSSFYCLFTQIYQTKQMNL